MSHHSTESWASRETNQSVKANQSGRSASGEAAMQPCLACGGSFPLTPENHDGYGPVCPDCGCLI